MMPTTTTTTTIAPATTTTTYKRNQRNDDNNKDSNDGVAVKTEATVAPPRKTSVIFADRKVSPPAGGESSRIGNRAAQTAR